MALIVGTDSYLLLADADAYLSAHYATTDPLMIAWTALTDANCEAYLRKACQQIDRQPLVGFKAVSTQALAFPRTIYSEYGPAYVNSAYIPYGDNWYVQSSVPAEVLNAQCEIALSLASGISERVELQRQGVKSFSLGKLSETYSGTQNRVVSQEAKELLAPYLAGSVRIV